MISTTTIKRAALFAFFLILAVGVLSKSPPASAALSAKCDQEISRSEYGTPQTPECKLQLEQWEHEQDRKFGFDVSPPNQKVDDPGVDVRSAGLEIRAMRWHQQGAGTRVQFAIRNSSATDYAFMIWHCDFRDHDGFLVDRGEALVFTNIPKQTITLNTQSVDTNGMFWSMKCSLDHASAKSPENERLFPPTNNISFHLNDPRAGWTPIQGSPH